MNPNSNNKPPARKPANKRANNRPRGSQPQNGQPRVGKNGKNGMSVSRGAAIRAQRRSLDDARKMVDKYGGSSKPEDNNRRRANVVTDDFDKLKITFLGGQEAIGEKNMQVVEWQNDAIILDCGNNLGLELPGINYSIADTSYLEAIKHKIRAYVVSHGHLDHLGGLKHIVPKFPAPIYASRFTAGVIEKSFDDVPQGGEHYTPKLIIMNMDNHERLKVGPFVLELVRITHSVPESSLIVLDTPVGRIINTGDWRLDPEPLDEKPTDVTRLNELAKEGVLLLMSDSTGADKEGRTPTESTLQESITDVIGRAPGRVFVAMFSSNMNRTQMVINAATAAGRKVALDGRGMLTYAEIAVRQGLLKVPKGTLMAMRDIAKIADDKILVMCTGGQGEPNAALSRMAEGTHSHIKLHPGDTVVVSSTPIPGNNIRYQMIGNQLTELGVFLFSAPTHAIDGCGPLHVSGHAARDEYREMLHIVKPKYFLPIYAGARHRKRMVEMAVEEGWQRDHTILARNGDSILFTADKWEQGPEAPTGNILVDQTGAVVSGIVVKDRVILAEEGMVAVILTIDKKSGQLLTSPDIITRGFIYIRDSEELMNGLRTELKRAVAQRFKRIDLDRFKAELKDHVTHYLYDQTQRSPIVIPVVNIIAGSKGQNDKQSAGQGQNAKKPAVQTPSPEDLAKEQQKRFEQMRAKLLKQEPSIDRAD